MGGRGLPSGVSSSSACAIGEDSGPEEKSISKVFRGVVKGGSRYGEAGTSLTGLLKKYGFPFGSRSEGKEPLFGELDCAWDPPKVVSDENIDSGSVFLRFFALSIASLWKGDVGSIGP